MNQSEHLKFCDELATFISHSPTPYHCVQTIAQELTAAGFHELSEFDQWELHPHSGYFIRKGGSIIALRKGELRDKHRFQIIGGHTDSPCLKVKPHPENYFENYLNLGVEIYGSALLSTWFDRNLSLAGRVSFINHNGTMQHCLVNFRRPLAIIPNLAIHLNPRANEERNINKQKEMPPLVCQLDAPKGLDFAGILIEQLQTEHQVKAKDILSFDLFFYDTQAPTVSGLKDDFFTASRLDNQLSCFLAMKALLAADGNDTAVLVCKDHEEVGSASDTGAEGPFLKYTLERIVGKKDQEFYRAMARSFLISLDNAHGVHPNYTEKHDQRHGPLLNEGPVIKINANQRYATTSESAAYFQWLCQKNQVPVQKFVVRSDMGCGSTIGPITATLLGVQTIDIGVPTFAMHSIRETCGSRDPLCIFKILKSFYED